MKKILFVLMMIVSVSIANAQWTVSPEVGITTYKNNLPGSDKWNTGWKIGMAVEYELIPVLSFKSGLHYTQRNDELKPIPWTDDHAQLNISDGESKRHYLQIPVMAQLNLPLSDAVQLHLAAGPYIGYCIALSKDYGNYSFGDLHPNELPPSYGYESGEQSGLYGQLDPYADDKFDWGLSFSAGLEVNRLYFNLGYELSLGKEFKKEFEEPDFHTLSLSVGYKFRL